MKTTMLTISACIMCLLASAQSSSIDDIRKNGVRAIGEINDGVETKGYYYYVVNDKVDKKTNKYTLGILDANLKKLKDEVYEDSKYQILLENSFNGKDLMFLFYNTDTRVLDYQIYGSDGKKKNFGHSRELSKKENQYLSATYGGFDVENEQAYKGLYPVKNKGFVSILPSREDKDFTFQVDYVSSEKKKTWSYIMTEGVKRAAADYLGYHNNVIFLSVMKFDSKLDQKPETVIMGLDIETGKVLFEKSNVSKQKIMPLSLTILDDGRVVINGEYFEADENEMKNFSNGIAFWTMGDDGKIITENYISWTNDLSKYFEVNSKGKVEKFGYMYMHNIVQTADGNVYAIVEGFRKAASALGIASKLLSNRGGISAVKMKITDMALLKMDKNFKLKDANIYPKSDNNIELPNGFEYLGAPIIAKYIKYAMNGFDYEYTQRTKDNSSFKVLYADYEKSKEFKGATYNSITVNNGKITTDKIQLSTKNVTRLWVLPAKPGQLLLCQYYKKERKMDLNFEKLN